MNSNGRISDVQGKVCHCRGSPGTELADYVRLGGFPATHLQKYSNVGNTFSAKSIANYRNPENSWGRGIFKNTPSPICNIRKMLYTIK